MGSLSNKILDLIYQRWWNGGKKKESYLDGLNKNKMEEKWRMILQYTSWGVWEGLGVVSSKKNDEEMEKYG